MWAAPSACAVVNRMSRDSLRGCESRCVDHVCHDVILMTQNVNHIASSRTLLHQHPPILWQLCCLPVRQRVQFKVAVPVFQCLSGNASTYLTDSLLTLCCSTGNTLPIGVSQRLNHGSGTRYLLNYDNVTLSACSNACWRHIRWGTTALCDILVKSAVQELSNLTYVSH